MTLAAVSHFVCISIHHLRRMVAADSKGRFEIEEPCCWFLVAKTALDSPTGGNSGVQVTG